MNNCIIIGRLTADPTLKEVKTSKGLDWVSNFTLAVKVFGVDQAQFIPVVVWGGKAKSVADYKKKGEELAVRGSLQIRQYEKDGQKHKVAEIVANEVTFVGGSKEPKASDDGEAAYYQAQVVTSRAQKVYEETPRDLTNYQSIDASNQVSDDDLPF